MDVYISFNGPTGGDPWMAQSHDSGATWTQTKLVDSDRYFFDFDSDVAADGTVYFAETSILYGGGGNKGTTPTGPIEEHVFISRDRGATWENRIVASVQPGARLRRGRLHARLLPRPHRRCRPTATGKVVVPVRRRDDGRRPADHRGPLILGIVFGGILLGAIVGIGLATLILFRPVAGVPDQVDVGGVLFGQLPWLMVSVGSACVGAYTRLR